MPIVYLENIEPRAKERLLDVAIKNGKECGRGSSIDVETSQKVKASVGGSFLGNCVSVFISRFGRSVHLEAELDESVEIKVNRSLYGAQKEVEAKVDLIKTEHYLEDEEMN
jgi:hypothetical protein